MFTPLLKSERFLNEYETFKNEIAKVNDYQIRAQLDQELISLRTSVQAIDEAHEQLMFGNNNHELITELREKIKTLRQSIDTKLSVWRES